MNLRSSLVKRWCVLGASLATGLLLVVVVLVLLPAGRTVAADLDNSAHIVVQFGNGVTAVRPVTWTGTISRVVALQAAGFTVEHAGDAVCSIEGIGCPASDCFCPDQWWAQGEWDGSAWSMTYPPPNPVDGDVIAFRYNTQVWGLTGLLPGARSYVAASDALEWMRGQQQADGSYDDGYDATGASVRALIAVGAGGYDPDEWGNPSLLYNMTVLSRTETAEYAAKSAAGVAKLAIGAGWTRQWYGDFAGMNLPISLTAHYSPTTGAYGGGSGDTAWAMLGLYAMQQPIPAKAVDFLAGVQNADGGWAWNEWGTSSEVQHTATCVQALLAAGTSATSTEIVRAMDFIESGKNADGGYAYVPAGPSDVGATSYVIQTQLFLGSRSAGNWCSEINCAYLLGVQQPDGSYPSGFSPLLATQDAIPALMHPVMGASEGWTYNCYGLNLPLTLKQ